MEGKELELASLSIRISNARGLAGVARQEILSAVASDVLQTDVEVGAAIPPLSDAVIALEEIDGLLERAQEPIRATLARLYSEGTRAAVLAPVAEIRP